MLVLANFILQLSSLFILCSEAQGSSISFIPNSPLCVGEEVTMICYVQAPTAENFGLNFATISINGSIPAIHSLINGNTISGIDTSRYTADTVGLTVTQSRPGARLVISNYLPSDSDTTFQCAGQFPNGTFYIPIAPMRPMSQAVPPSTPVVTVSPTNCTHTLISWTAPASDRSIASYYMYRDSTLLTYDITDTQFVDRDQLMVDTDYTYSVIASSCAGSSSEGTVIYNIRGYGLDTGVSLSISYSNTCYTSSIGVNWTLYPNPGAPPLPLTYSLNLMYSYTQADMPYSYRDSSSFYLLSDVTTHSVAITAPSFSTNASVIFNITACINITEQCGASFVGETVCGTYSTGNIPVLTTTTTTTTQSPVNTHTTNTTHPVSSPQFLSTIIILVIIILLLSLLFLSILTLLVAVIVYLLRKNKRLQSLSPPSQPPHPYEYIDLNTALSDDTAATPSPHKDSAYYTAMHSAVSVSLPSQGAAPTYANLK